jgi:hypothetical protein
VFIARARTSSGEEQPLNAVRNALGYANNGTSEVGIQAT